MRVLLVSVNTERISMPVLPLGLASVGAASRRAGHDVRLLDLAPGVDPGRAIEAAVRDLRPGVIGVSARNIDDLNMREPRFLLAHAASAVDACRACSNATIVVGGAGYSIFPQAALERLGADFGVRGGGEAVFPALLARLAAGESPCGLPGVHARGGKDAAAPDDVPDLDALPWPGEDLWAGIDRADPELFVPVQSRRGCPLDCSYCSTALIEGRRFRFRSPAAVADHVARLARLGFARFFFVDNVFNLPPWYAFALCREIASRRLGITWRAIVYPHCLDADLVRAMADAGCTEASVGFESGSDVVLHAMNKRFRTEDVRAAVGLLAEHGIRRLGFLLLGGPGETPDTVRESLAFADSLRLDGLRIATGIRIYPGTRLAAVAEREGVIAPGDDLLEPRFYFAQGLEGVLPEPQKLPG